MKNHPFAGGADYARILANALELRRTLHATPPATGGTQFSLRLRPGRLAMINHIADMTRWNRNQVIDALLEVGLAAVFEAISPKAAEGLITAAASKAEHG